MKSILTLKKLYYDDHMSRADISGKTIKEIEKIKSRCKTVAEVRAFIDTLIDFEYRDLSVFDITGETKNKVKALEPKEALRAKNLVCKYIWGYSWQELKKKFKSEDEIKNYISKNSVLMRRLERGNNVVIFGESDSPCGRTMIASIIMREVIKMRMFIPDIISHTYDWVDFQTLTESLKDNTLENADYKTADWLVVDNICFKAETGPQRAFRTNLIDPFFMYRMKNNLPTILVFQYDIRQRETPLYKAFGVGIASIVNSPRVCKIPLNKKSEKD